MALPLAKLTFIVGAGYLGTVLAKGGRLSDILSSPIKLILNPLQRDDSSISSSKPKNEALMQQINSLRNELQIFASSSRSLTIVTDSRSGSRKYGLVVLVVVVGSGYIWWKGIKIPDMMFATRRGLNDACASVAKQLETVYSSIAATKKHLSTRINLVDSKVDECLDNTSSIKEDVPLLRVDLSQIGTDVQYIQKTVQSLKTKINSIEGRQDETLNGLKNLVSFAMNLENDRTTVQIEDAIPTSSKLAIESSEPTPSRSLSLPASSSVEPPSPSHLTGRQRSQSSTLGSGLKDLTGISEVTEIKDQSSLTSEQAAPAVLGRNLSGLWSALPRIYK